MVPSARVRVSEGGGRGGVEGRRVGRRERALPRARSMQQRRGARCRYACGACRVRACMSQIGARVEREAAHSAYKTRRSASAGDSSGGAACGAAACHACALRRRVPARLRVVPLYEAVQDAGLNECAGICSSVATRRGEARCSASSRHMRCSSGARCAICAAQCSAAAKSDKSARVRAQRKEEA